MLAFLTLLLAGLATAQEWELIWEDNFDTFDTSKWDHEVTMWGGGVSFNTTIKYYTERMMVMLFLSCLQSDLMENLEGPVSMATIVLP